MWRRGKRKFVTPPFFVTIKSLKEILLLGRRIRICPVSKSQLAELSDDDDTDLLGFYCSKESAIYIYSGLDGELFKRVLIHEITHALINISGLSELLKKKQEESICNLMEAYLDLFRNSKFIELLND